MTLIFNFKDRERRNRARSGHTEQFWPEGVPEVRECHHGSPMSIFFGTLLILTHNKCPMHKSLIDISLLEASEKAWLDSYHQEVFEKVSPLLVHDTRALEWLKRETSPLESA